MSLSVSIMCVHGLAFHWSRLGLETLSEEAGVSPPSHSYSGGGPPTAGKLPPVQKKGKKSKNNENSSSGRI